MRSAGPRFGAGGRFDYIPRTEAEAVEDHKQVVTYVLVTARS